MTEREDLVINFLKQNGPSLPVQVSKQLGDNVMLASAILAGLTTTKQIKLTTKRIGNSPLYYTQEHEEAARKIIYERLDPREKELVQYVTQKGFIHEKDLTPTERFFIKGLTDFFEPLGTPTGLMWKTHNTQIIQPKEEQKTEQIIVAPLKNPVEQQTTIQEKPKAQKEPDVLEIKEKKEDDFTKRIKNFLVEKRIRILKIQPVKNNTETNYIIEVQSDLIPQKYFVKARKKNKINENDLTNAFFEGKKEKMPIIYITTGELSKKSEKFLKEEFGQNFQFLKIKL